MSLQLQLHLRDLSRAMVEAWRVEFAGVDGVWISQGDIFSTKEGVVADSDPIDVQADAIVSPANSFGFMDGGIDAVYTHLFGFGLQQRLQSLLRREHGGELAVGQAVIVETGRSEIPWCISAPTMRVPSSVANTANAYLALRAALRAAVAHNECGRAPIRRVLCPGLGTAVGQMPPQRCARQMRVAWQRAFQPLLPKSIDEAYAEHVDLLE